MSKQKQSKEVDPYKYFKEKFNQGGQKADQSDSDAISENSKKIVTDDDKFPSDEEYSLNNDDDFEISASIKKSEGNNNFKVNTEARERL